MPPESLSTLAVMNPGPRTAKNSSIRIRQRFNIRAGSYCGVIEGSLPDHNRPGRGARNWMARPCGGIAKQGLTACCYHGTLVYTYQEESCHKNSKIANLS